MSEAFFGIASRRNFIAAAAGIAAMALPGLAALASSLPVLTVEGGGSIIDLDLERLESFPVRRIDTATPWTEGVARFEGALMRDVLEGAGVAGEKIRAVALNDYASDIPFADARENDVIIAYRLNGSPMSVRDKGPFWIIYPFDENPALRTEQIYARCVWQLRRIVVSD